jgi:hypothetical protein
MLTCQLRHGKTIENQYEVDPHRLPRDPLKGTTPPRCAALPKVRRRQRWPRPLRARTSGT